MKITQHAHNRINERTDFSAREKTHNISEAWKHGHKISEYRDPFYSFLLSKQKDGDHTTVKVYNDIIYIFDNRKKRLITAYNVLDKYLPTKKFLGVKKRRCVILYEGCCLTEGGSNEPLVFKTKQNAMNYVKNCSWLDKSKVVIIPI